MLPLQAWNTRIHSILPHTEEVITKEGLGFCLATIVHTASKSPVPSLWLGCGMTKMQYRGSFSGLPAASKTATQKVGMWRAVFLKTDSNKYRCPTLGNPGFQYNNKGGESQGAAGILLRRTAAAFARMKSLRKIENK